MVKKSNCFERGLNIERTLTSRLKEKRVRIPIIPAGVALTISVTASVLPRYFGLQPQSVSVSDIISPILGLTAVLIFFIQRHITKRGRISQRRFRHFKLLVSDVLRKLLELNAEVSEQRKEGVIILS